MVDKAIIQKSWTNLIRQFERNGKMTVKEFIDHNVDRLEVMYLESCSLDRNDRESREWTDDYNQYMDECAIQIMKERYDLFLEDN